MIKFNFYYSISSNYNEFKKLILILKNVKQAISYLIFNAKERFIQLKQVFIQILGKFYL